MKNTCKIAEHIPREDGLFCECGYFKKVNGGDEYMKYVRDTVSDFRNFKNDVIKVVIEDVPHQYQDRLLILLK
jgi:hypothetical protein